MSIKAGDLVRFHPVSLDVSRKLNSEFGLIPGDVILVVGWSEGKVACKLMEEPVTEKAIAKAMGSLYSDFDLEQRMVRDNFRKIVRG